MQIHWFFIGFKHISLFDVFFDFAILNGAGVLQYVLKKFKKSKNKKRAGPWKYDMF